MKIGFIGLGNVGGKLAGSLLRNNFDLTVRDLDEKPTPELFIGGAIIIVGVILIVFTKNKKEEEIK